MKIKVVKKSYEDVLAIKPRKPQKPKRVNILWRTLLYLVSKPTLVKFNYKLKKVDMDKLGKREPALFLMNHSSFTDMKMAAASLYPRKFNIVCTYDAFMGKNWLMKQIGCTPTHKYVNDVALIRNIIHATNKNRHSVLMYPEAGYSFDGTSTALPDSLAECLKMLKVPLVVIRTYGAFARDPLYNNLQLRKVRVSADVEYVLSPEQIAESSNEELNAIIAEKFSFDNFRHQQETKTKITEKFRADYLNRVLYKCPECLTEGEMEGKGTTLSCKHCGKKYELTEYGFLEAHEGETKFNHIPDWFAWQRACVRKEIERGEYSLDVPVDIYVLVDTKKLYNVGEGRLVHNEEGFHLTGCDGKLDYKQKTLSSYSVNSDYYWYEIGDMISIGGGKILYYCFPKVKGDFVAKTRLAAEELYKIHKIERKKSH